MSNFVRGVGSFVSYTFNSLDQSSAANDIIVIRHRDGSLRSSPFNVRFGRAKVLRPGDKVVTIATNGAPTAACMKMGEDGVAFWLVPTTSETREELLTSPLASPRSTDSPNSIPSMQLDQSSSPRSPVKDASPESSPGLTPSDIANRAVVEDSGGKVVQVTSEAEMELPPSAGSKYDQLLASLQSEKPADPAAEGPESSGSDMPNNSSLRLSKFASAEDVTALHKRVQSLSEALQHPVEELGEKETEQHVVGEASGVKPPSQNLPPRQVSESALDDEDSSWSGSDTLFDSDEEEAAEWAQAVEDGVDPAVANARESTGPVPGQHVVNYKRSFQPLSADLEKLNLKPGANTIVFSTNSRLRGPVTIEAHIFLWDSDSKIVVSDIDGTITKSDVLGHILPKIGRDWTHPGICELYTNIARNGYQFLYVTARSVSQIESTKQFVFSIRQGNHRLPNGPLITAPDRLWDAITQEVGKRSHEFKIACLKSVASAYPKNSKPFYAGFGNRIGDVIAYSAVDIRKHKIFIIDASSAVHVAYVRQTYRDIAELVDVTFPPVDVVVRGARGNVPEKKDGMDEGEHMDQAFNSFNYWRMSPTAYFPDQQQHQDKEKEKAPGAAQLGTPTASAPSTVAAPGDNNSVTSSHTDPNSGSGSPHNSHNASPTLPPKSPPATDTADDSPKKGWFSGWGRQKSVQ